MSIPGEEDETALLQREYESHAAAYAPNVLAAALERIKARANWADTSPQCVSHVVPVIADAIREGRPFSMIRVGDGTGNLLGYRDPAYRRLGRFTASKILGLTFGTADFTDQEVDEIRAGLIGGIRSADVLGVSDDVRLERLTEIALQPGYGHDLRGFSGSRESYVAIADLLEREDIRPPVVASNHLHRYMAPHMAELLTGLERVCVVGPYDLAEPLNRRFGIGQVHTHLIPNLADTSGAGMKWYPDRFGEVLSQIDPAAHGQVHLVAAGLLAKTICTRIKERGGIAIDVGSLIDVWAGLGVRKYHDEAFIQANALSVT